MLDFLIAPAFAQDAAAQPSPMQPLIMLGIFFAVFFFLVIRPQMKRAKEHRNMVAALAKGDEVITSGGVLGRIEDVGESFITVEVADGVRLKLQRQAITAVLPKGTLKSI
ncbi:MAG: preprotein translocase subunit YajC [Xanthomonadales bacterium]|jgi:preprotein translocase subunit YajC|nr:preprotein translocase subunit YajC [Xanthomonadales bacterium]